MRSKAPPDHEWDENGRCKWCPAVADLHEASAARLAEAIRLVRELHAYATERDHRGYAAHLAAILSAVTADSDMLEQAHGE